MLRKISLLSVVVSLLTFGGIANAITLDEAKAKVEKQATERNLTSADRSEAVTTLQGLVEKGVPVEHAYNVVDACINQGIKGKELAEIAKSIESAKPEARDEAASVATHAIQKKYKAKETVQMVNKFNQTVGQGAPSEKTAEVMTRNMDRGVSSKQVISATERFGSDMKSGMSSEKAMERSMSMDKDKVRDMDRMGGSNMGRNPGMIDTGIGRGADMGGFGMGHGSGKGMGGGSMGGRR
ncbi:MAG: hypothetical protein QMD44_00205 [Thermodesulfovibrionales bacterium]|nr:hypothetical protein [Thermodesulfovibrionales bacterium]